MSELKSWYVPVAFGDKAMTVYPLNHRPDAGGIRVYMAEQIDSLLGFYPERATLCHDGHEPLVHFSKCPLCAGEAHGS